MQEKIVELIVFIVSEMQDNKELGDINLRELADIGYTETEISTALSWVVDKIAAGENVLFADSRKIHNNSFRVFHEAERAVIGPDEQGYLIMLRELGVIDGLETELIIERVMMSGFQKADMLSIKSIVASIMFDRFESDTPVSRFMLTSHDTIH
jgi:uncharacterized protein Smg (DUF494 family)